MFIVLYTRKPDYRRREFDLFSIFLHEHVLPGTSFNPAFSVVKLRSASTHRPAPAILCQVLSASAPGLQADVGGETLISWYRETM
jgi:hypothetical protein